MSDDEKDKYKFPYEWHGLKCKFCGRKIIVDLFQFGISHIASLYASCGECIKKEGISKEFEKQHPKEAEEIKEWLNEEKKSPKKDDGVSEDV